jgi:ribosome-binding factor A
MKGHSAPGRARGRPEAEHVRHAVEARRAVLSPDRGPHRAAREEHPVARHMAEDDPLARPREDHLVLADDIAAPQAREADRALPPGPGHPVAPAFGEIGEIGAAPPCRRLAEHQGRARGRVDLHPVMHLDDLDIVVDAEESGRSRHQRREQVHPEAHVAGFHDRRVAGGGGEALAMLSPEPGRADDEDEAGLGGEFGMDHRGRGRGEVEHGARDREDLERVIDDDEAARPSPHRLAEIAPDPVMARSGGDAGEPQAGRLVDRTHEHPPHPARGPDHGDGECVLHRILPRSSPSHSGRGRRAEAPGPAPLDSVPRLREGTGMGNRTISGKAPSQRQLRVGELIRRRLAEAFGRGEIDDPEIAGISITVGEVRISPDLRHATAYVLPLGGTGAERVVAALNRNRRLLRRIVTEGITLRYSPEIAFAVDTTFEQAERTRALLESEAVRRDVAAPDRDGGRED